MSVACSYGLLHDYTFKLLFTANFRREDERMGDSAVFVSAERNKQRIVRRRRN